MAVVAEELEREGICPRCGGLGVYRYRVEAPHYRGGAVALVRYRFSCMACGVEEEKRVYIPLHALYMMRYMIDPKLRGTVERARLIAELREKLAGAREP